MTERSAIEWIEEATLLFRNAGLATAGLYYIGSLPFVLALLFFWADMSSDAFAYQRILPASLGLAALYLWMNLWQAIYASELRKQVSGQASSPWTARRVLRVTIVQSAVQPSSLLVIPAGALLAIPFAWIYGFYQNVTVLAATDELRPSALLAQARAYSLIWTRQSWMMLAIQAGFGLVVAINLAIATFVLPRLLQTFFGVETTFTKSGTSLLNSTFFALVVGLTYLCLDPIMKAIYVLRCFYAESVRSGADLRVAFRRSLVTLAVLLIVASAPRAQAQTGTSTAELDRVIDQVIHQRQYAWRLPRQRPPESDAQKSFIVRVTESAVRTVRRWTRTLRRAFDEFVRWLLRRPQGERPTPGELSGKAGALRRWMYALLGVAAVAIAILLFLTLRRRRPSEAIAMADTMAVPVDLSQEDVSPAQMPEDGWRTMALEFLSRREFRMALRALYLASLAHLGEREMILLHRGKSNRDYQKELERRSRSTPELSAVFHQNVAVFESCWYGRREIGQEAIEAFLANLDRMRACVQ